MGRAITGNKALFKINGKKVGYALNVRPADSYGLQRVFELGGAEAVELATGAVTYQFTCSSYLINTAEGFAALGIVPESTTDLINGIEFDMEIIDNTDETKTLEHYTGCKINDNSRDYQANQVVGNDATIFALKKVPKR